MCTRSHFCLGLAVGMAAGTCLGIRMKTREKQIRRGINRAAQAEVASGAHGHVSFP